MQRRKENEIPPSKFWRLRAFALRFWFLPQDSAYDSEDDTSPYLIIGVVQASGLVAAPVISQTGLNANAKANASNWLATGYANRWNMTPSSFASYVKARKEHWSISSLGSIDADGIYLWSGSEPLVIDEAAKTRFVVIRWC